MNSSQSPKTRDSLLDTLDDIQVLFCLTKLLSESSLLGHALQAEQHSGNFATTALY